MKTINTNKLFTKQELTKFEKDLHSFANFSKEWTAKISADENLRIFFRDTSPKEICLALFGEEWLAENPLYKEKGVKTSLCDALYYLKKKCKDKKEKSTEGKKVLQMQKELDYIQNHFSEYNNADQQAIVTAIENLVISLGFQKLTKSKK